MKRIFALIIFFTLLLFIPLIVRSFAQNSSDIVWQEVPLQSGEVAEIVISPSNPDIMYTGFEVNSHSLYKSTDGGKNWTKVNGGGDHTKDIAVSPKDPKRVYFAQSHPLETTDLSFTSSAKGLYGGGGPPGFGAQTQTILTTGLSAGGSAVSLSSVEVFEADDNILYAARRGGIGMGGVIPKIYKSVNRGQSWDEVEVDLHEVNVLAIHPQNHGLILIGSRDGIYQSEDLGKTITKLDGTSGIISIEYQLSDPNIIYAASAFKVVKSADGGQSWKDITGGLKDIHRVRVSKSAPNILYASSFNGVFRSDDGGSSWRDVSGNLKAKNIQIVEIHPTNPDIAFVGHSSLWSSVRSEDRYKTGLLAHQGIFKTEDGGKTWERSDSGIKEYQFEEVAINPTKPYEAWVQSPASRGGYKTEDGGQNWRLSQTPTMHYPMRIRYSMQNPNKLYATGWQNGHPFSISEDGGVNWKFISEQVFFQGLEKGKSLFQSEGGGGAIHLHGLAVDPKNDKIVFAGSISDSRSPVNFPLKGAHIFKSEDGGNSWKEMDEGFEHGEDTAIHDIIIDPKNTSIIYVSTTRHESEKGIGVYKSEDAGKNWREVSGGLSDDSLSVNTLIIDPENTKELVAATFGGLYKSTDGGENWKKTSSASSFDVEYVIDDSKTVYASTDDGVLQSRDFGNTWIAVNSGLPPNQNKFGLGQAASGNPMGHRHFGAGVGVDKTGQVIYAAFQDKGLYVARLADIQPKDPVSEFGSSPYGFGSFGPDGSNPFSTAGGPNFLLILAAVGGFVVLVTLVLRKQLDTPVSQDNQKTDDFDV